MVTYKHNEHQQDTSPWTEAYAVYCVRHEDGTWDADEYTNPEQQPTHDALTDAYCAVHPAPQHANAV